MEKSNTKSSVEIKKINESLCYLSSDDYKLKQELVSFFSYFIPGFQFMPSYKNGWFDGKVHLISERDYTFPSGLASDIYSYCTKSKIECLVENSVLDMFHDRIDTKDMDEFFASKRFHSKGSLIKHRDDQYEAVQRALVSKRCVNICPTSFGKSLCITMQCLYYISRGFRCLIVVPTKDLVDQFYNDIEDYATTERGRKESWLPKRQMIYSGQDKNIHDDTEICISTWQSLSRIASPDFMNQFDAIILDECHKGSAKKIHEIMMMATNVRYRTGWTGTLSEEIISELLVKGLFGPSKKIITTKELMDKEIVAKLLIIITKLNYPENICKEVCEMDYRDQVKFTEECDQRTDKILDIVSTQEKTGLIFYKTIKNGEEITRRATEKLKGRNIYFVHSNFFTCNGVRYKTFDELKELIEKDSSGVLIANYQIASTGISIKNLHWLVFASTLKSYISVLQSIGRGLRISDSKHDVVLIDIVDNFSYMKRKRIKKNYALNHFEERFRIYCESKFDYKIANMSVKI